MRPRILYLVTHCPTTRTYGAQLRTLNIGKLLQRIGKVTMVIASVADWSEAEIKASRELFDIKYVFKFRLAPLSGIKNRIKHEFDPRFLNTHGFIVTEEDTKVLKKIIDDHDIVWIHTIRLANVFRIYRWEKTIIDLDDLMSRYYAEEARHAAGWCKIVAKRNFWIWRRRESTILKRFDIVTVCSKEDKDYLGGGDRILVIPNGFEDCGILKRRTDNYKRIGFIGKISYEPNFEGITWFLKTVWPKILKEVKGAEFRIVGDGDSRLQIASNEGVTKLGWLVDPSKEMSTWSGTIVPIFKGGGTRIKIAEALARGIPIVSTSLGAFGYEVENGKEILIANSEDDFATSCIKLLKIPKLGDRLAQFGRSLFLQKYSWEAIYKSVETAVVKVMQNISK